VDLLGVVMANFPSDWQTRIKPQTRQWAEDHMEYGNKQIRLAKERALAKLTYDDKIALGLPT
jgi:hypothetical protein